jgi:hypothetical protein
MSLLRHRPLNVLCLSQQMWYGFIEAISLAALGVATSCLRQLGFPLARQRHDQGFMNNGDRGAAIPGRRLIPLGAILSRRRRKGALGRWSTQRIIKATNKLPGSLP